VVYGACHRTGQLGETAPPQPYASKRPTSTIHERGNMLIYDRGNKQGFCLQASLRVLSDSLVYIPYSVVYKGSDDLHTDVWTVLGLPYLPVYSTVFCRSRNATFLPQCDIAT
jgi:hypothetical protein